MKAGLSNFGTVSWRSPGKRRRQSRRASLPSPSQVVQACRLGCPRDQQAGRLSYEILKPALSEGATAAPAVVIPVPLPASLTSLLAGHVLRDGEAVILILKPSLWYITLSSLRFGAAVLIALIGIQLWVPHPRLYLDAGGFLLLGRLLWSVLTWMARLYVLTDQRILRLSGVFVIEILDCPLRKVARTRVFATFRERLLGLGSIEIIPQDESRRSSAWQTVKRPREVNEQIVAAIRRARQGNGHGCFQ